MCRKISLILALILISLISFNLGAYAGQPVKIFVDGSELHPDVPAQIIGGRALVPLRFVAEALGAEVIWDEQTKSVIITSRKPLVKQLNGIGNGNTENLELRAGFTHILFQYTGSSNYIVRLLDADKNEIELIANEIGHCSGNKVISVKQGIYQFQVEAAGPWSIVVEQ